MPLWTLTDLMVLTPPVPWRQVRGDFPAKLAHRAEGAYLLPQ